MSIVIVPSRRPTLSGRARNAERSAERRRLKRRDVLSGRLAELFSIEELLGRAAEVVGLGWVQGAWFTVATTDGAKAVTAYDLRLADTHPVTGACLVGAVVHAAGGPAAARSQRVQRTLDLTWHVLREDSERPVRWCPGRPARMLQVLDLTHWNDAPNRTQGQVVELLLSAQRAAAVQRARCLAEQSGTTCSEPGARTRPPSS